MVPKQDAGGGESVAAGAPFGICLGGAAWLVEGGRDDIESGLGTGMGVTLGAAAEPERAGATPTVLATPASQSATDPSKRSQNHMAAYLTTSPSQSNQAAKRSCAPLGRMEICSQVLGLVLRASHLG